MKGETFCIWLLIAAIPVFCNRAAAGAADGVESKQDSFEYQLEIRGHEDLAAQKSNMLNQLNEFTTDGCSGGLSAGWQYLSKKIAKFQEIHGMQPPWESCCIAHDWAYHPAGSRETTVQQSFELRKNADQTLKMCVQQIGKQRAVELSGAYGMSSEEVEKLYAVVSSLMFRVVRMGGLPCSGLPWRWGYGWPDCE